MYKVHLLPGRLGISRTQRSAKKMNCRLHFFTVPALAPSDAQQELNLFLQYQRVVAVEKQCVVSCRRSQGLWGTGRQQPNAPRAAFFVA